MRNFDLLMVRRPHVFPCSLKKMTSPILFLHSEDDHLVPIQIARQVRPAQTAALRLCEISPRFLMTPLNCSLCQTYEVAASAQGTDRVKLVTFDGSLGYLHNGLYRDPKMPGVLKWVDLARTSVVVRWLWWAIWCVFVSNNMAVPLLLRRTFVSSLWSRDETAGGNPFDWESADHVCSSTPFLLLK